MMFIVHTAKSNTSDFILQKNWGIFGLNYSWTFPTCNTQIFMPYWCHNKTSTIKIKYLKLRLHISLLFLTYLQYICVIGQDETLTSNEDYCWPHLKTIAQSPGRLLLTSPGRLLLTSPGRLLLTSPGRLLLTSPGRLLLTSPGRLPHLNTVADHLEDCCWPHLEDCCWPHLEDCCWPHLKTVDDLTWNTVADLTWILLLTWPEDYCWPHLEDCRWPYLEDCCWPHLEYCCWPHLADCLI
jgi:hypothetical protein